MKNDAVTQHIKADDRQNQKKRQLMQIARGTGMGTLLRKFWHPVALSKKLAKGSALPLRILGEELTLYRGESGTPYLVGGRCAHRLTVLHTGWVEGERIRCVYHGWQYDGTGQCVQRPAEKDTGLPNCKIPGYALHEYCGLVFAYLGDGSAPEFDLPRKEVFERKEGAVYARAETWPCHWLQQVENSLDATHVSTVHQIGQVGPFGAAVTSAVPELSYLETDAGIEQTATRSRSNIRKSDWTFPNNNHIVVPGLAQDDPWIDIGIWMVPHDDQTTTRFIIYSTPQRGEDAERFIRYFDEHGDYNPADFHDELFHQNKFPEDPYIQLVSAQDYIATVGQGAVVDTTREFLGRSDLGIVTLRRIFWRELEAIQDGRPTKHWHRLAHHSALPTQPGPTSLIE
jgi:5,5'-dehydrodivanillate O-demethylase